VAPMSLAMDLDTFGRLVDEALAEIPAELTEQIDNCVVLVEEDPPDDEPDLLGLYDGVPLTERDTGYAGALPDRIYIFMNPTLAICHTEADVVDEVHITVVHEIAHHFGISDERLDELGYA